MTTGKLRLDDLLVEREFFADRDTALRAILAGEVRLGSEVAKSAGLRVSSDIDVTVLSHARFVSRGGNKLQGALDAFKFDVSGMSCLDCGASTGGFTDCLLQNGASRVCAVDVGYGQFAWSLRQDPRVILFERTNIRSLPFEESGAPFDLAVADISFAPLHSYLASVKALLKEDGSFITLVKPQFEAAKGDVGDHGVVRDVAVHISVLQRAVQAFEQMGLAPQGLCHSPITGPMGNIEYLLLGTCGAKPLSLDIERTVYGSHETLL